MCSGVVKNMAGLVVCRCFLGIFEAAFGAGAPVFLSFFYQRHEVGLRVSLLLGMAPLANTFASSLAYGITQIKTSLAPWRLLFLIGKLDCSMSNWRMLCSFSRYILTDYDRGRPHGPFRACGLFFPSRLSGHSQVLDGSRTN